MKGWTQSNIRRHIWHPDKTTGKGTDEIMGDETLVTGQGWEHKPRSRHIVVCLFVCLFICLFFSVSTHKPRCRHIVVCFFVVCCLLSVVCLFVCLFVLLFVRLFVCLFVC